jgi:transposase
MERILMGHLEARRLGWVQAAMDGKCTNQEAADRLRMSKSQFKRLRRRVREQGAGGVLHGNRGRIPVNRVTDAVRAEVVELLTGEVKLNDHHIADLLALKQVELSPATVRRIRLEHQLSPKRRRRPSKHRRRRERKLRRGAMVLIDGSPFQWFDADGANWTLLGAIDDATSEILALTLRPSEDLHGYMALMHELFTRHGIPLEMYGDRSGILIRSDDHWSLEEQLAGRQTPTQFGRMLEALEVRFIPATSPQAKGRIERLWATLQDRLAAELRLLGHTTLPAALAYLPRFMAAHNDRFACAPIDAVSDFRRPPRDLDRSLACVYERVVARDNTVQVAGRWLQVLRGPAGRSYHRARVEVRELLDGRMMVLHPRHGLIAEQPSPGPDFTLTNRRGARSSRINAKDNATRSRLRDQLPARIATTRARKAGIGTYTNRRSTTPGRGWKKYFPLSPSARPKRPEGVQNR